MKTVFNVLRNTWSCTRCLLLRDVGRCSASTTRSLSNEASSPRSFHPRRAMLYVPGNDKKKLHKIPTLNVDCAVMDCEDGVAINRKTEARVTIATALDELSFGATECAVRVNSVDSGLMSEDMQVIFQAKTLPQAIMLPKVENVQELYRFTECMEENLKHRNISQKPSVILFVESAMGLLNLRDICTAGTELSRASVYQLEGIVFGSDDFVADIGATRTDDALEVLYARQKVVLIAKAFRLQAIDMVHIDYKDLESLRKHSLEGAQMGFTGKQVIHPSQIPVVQEAFSPSPAKMTWARELIQAFNLHQQEGKGAFTFHGRMIDMPLLLQAQNILHLAEQIENQSS